MRDQTRVVWQNMKTRCENSLHKNYHGKGITYCEEWKSYPQFLRDMGYKPVGKELDRIDNNKGYSKDNCRWVTHSENNFNRGLQKNNKSGVKGVSKYHSQWRAKWGRDTLYSGPDFFAAVCARKSFEAKYHLYLPAAGTESNQSQLPASTVTKDD